MNRNNIDKNSKINQLVDNKDEIKLLFNSDTAETKSEPNINPPINSQFRQDVVVLKALKFPPIVPIIKDLKNLTNIGKGGYSEVFVATIDLATEDLPTSENAKTISVAVKHDTVNPDSILEIVRLALCNHPNIVKCFGKTADNRIVMEYMDGGDLRGYLKHLTWESSLAVAFEVAKGLSHIHTLGYVYRDLKSLNILINSRGEIKITDLESLALQGSVIEESPKGSLYWQADELYSSANLEITPALDVFSFGVFLGELLTKDIPKIKNGIEVKHLKEYKSKGGLYRIFSESKLEIKDSSVETKENITSDIEKILKKLYAQCVNKTPAERPQMNRIVAELSSCITKYNIDIPTVIKSLFEKNQPGINQVQAEQSNTPKSITASFNSLFSGEYAEKRINQSQVQAKQSDTPKSITVPYDSHLSGDYAERRINQNQVQAEQSNTPKSITASFNSLLSGEYAEKRINQKGDLFTEHKIARSTEEKCNPINQVHSTPFIINIGNDLFIVPKPVIHKEAAKAGRNPDQHQTPTVNVSAQSHGAGLFGRPKDVSPKAAKSTNSTHHTQHI